MSPGREGGGGVTFIVLGTNLVNIHSGPFGMKRREKGLLKDIYILSA